MKNRFFTFFSLFVLISLSLPSLVSALGSQENNQYYKDVELIIGKALSPDEKKSVDSVFIFYNAYYGYSVRDITPQKAANNMTKEQYTNTIHQAAKVSTNVATKGIHATGKAGEKILKTIIITTEEAAKATGTWINEKSDDYDKRNK